MNALELLEKQHREVESLLAEYKRAAEAKDLERKLAGFHVLANHIAVHSTLVERVFYPSILVDEMEGLLHESLRSHLGLKRLIAELLDFAPEDPLFDDKMKLLEDRARAYVAAEEAVLFPAIRETFPPEEMERLGMQLESTLRELHRDSMHEPGIFSASEAPPLLH